MSETIILDYVSMSPAARTAALAALKGLGVDPKNVPICTDVEIESESLSVETFQRDKSGKGIKVSPLGGPLTRRVQVPITDENRSCVVMLRAVALP